MKKNTNKAEIEKNIDNFTGYIAAFLIGAGLAGGCCWYFMDYSQRDIIEVGKQFVTVKECRDILEKNAGVSEGHPVESAINSYVKELAVDEYTFYYEEDDIRDMTNYVNTSGTAEKSGFKVDISSDGNILITEVDEKLTAYKQGIRKGDVIVSINGESVSSVGYENLTNKLLGKDGTSVKITIRRDDEVFDIDFVRSSVIKSSVHYEKMGDVAYIKISAVNQVVEGQLDRALKESKGQNKVIIDLRNNGGGDIDAGTYLAAQCCGHSKCVEKHFDGHEVVHEYNFGTSDTSKKYVVIINEKTASMAEAITASLKQEVNATIVGCNSLGKGIFQIDRPLSNGGYLHYTGGTFTAEDWENWQGKGIAPDVEVSMDAELIGTDKDVQLKKAIELLD